MRWPVSKADTLARLREAMDAAAEALDFEEARRLRDRISLLRGGADADDAADADTSGLLRQQPGNMGIGSSVPKPVRPDGWVMPIRPGPMTTNESRKRR